MTCGKDCKTSDKSLYFNGYESKRKEGYHVYAWNVLILDLLLLKTITTLERCRTQQIVSMHARTLRLYGKRPKIISNMMLR